MVKTIDKAIRSVVSDDTEIICVNDGSTDGTRRMLRRYANVRLIEMDRNRGPGPALNAGIEEARTNLIFVLGADNYLRLSYATSMENIVSGLKRIDDLIDRIIS